MTQRLYSAIKRALGRSRGEAGFGLIEMTVALTLLAVGISTVGGLFITGNVTLRRAAKQDTGTVLADRTLEQYRALKFNDIALKDTLVSSADSTYTANQPSGTSDITTSASPCAGSTGSIPITCYPSRTIPDTVSGSGETAPDGGTYRIDTYVTWGCPATDDCTTNTFEKVKVVTVMVRDSSNALVYKTSTTFDRLTGGNLSTAQAGTIALGNGGGSGSTYINASNYTSLTVDVTLTAVAGDVVHVALTDGAHNVVPATQTAGTTGSVTVAFSNISVSTLNDGTITITTWTTNSSSTSSTASQTFTKDTTTPTTPTTLALQNGQGAGGVYINSSNQTSVSASVGLGSTSVSADTVSVVFSDGTQTSSAGTASASSGAGTVTTTGVDASSLNNGTVTGYATVKDTAGNVSTSRTATFTKSVVGLSAPTSVTLANGQGAGNAYINSSNASSVSIAVGLDSTSLSTNTVTVVVSNGATSLTAVSGAATAGAGTKTFTGINTTTLSDGTITVKATVTDAAANTSTATTATFTKDTVAPAAPSTVALANGLGTGNAYVNGTNKTSVSISVGLGSSSVNTDTVKATLTVGASSTTPASAAATSGAGTVTLTGINASSLSDGTVTASATSQDAAGNVSAAKTTTFTKDTVATLTGVTYSDKNTTTADQIMGTGETGASLTITENLPVVATIGTYTLAASAFTYNVAALNGKTVSIPYKYTLSETDVAGNTASSILTGTDTK